MWTEERKLYMLVAVDRTSRFAFAELHERATRRVAADFLHRLIAAVPYRIHTVLTERAIEGAIDGVDGSRSRHRDVPRWEFSNRPPKGAIHGPAYHPGPSI